MEQIIKLLIQDVVLFLGIYYSRLLMKVVENRCQNKGISWKQHKLSIMDMIPLHYWIKEFNNIDPAVENTIRALEGRSRKEKRNNKKKRANKKERNQT